jgi:hypothetical protein
MTLTAACAFSEASGIPPHSTGKERDSESGNDYFEARHYGVRLSIGEAPAMRRSSRHKKSQVFP